VGSRHWVKIYFSDDSFEITHQVFPPEPSMNKKMILALQYFSEYVHKGTVERRLEEI